MIHFIVEHPKMKITNSTPIYDYRGLLYTVCGPEMTDKVKAGLQGMTGNHIPVFLYKNWEQQADKLLFGK